MELLCDTVGFSSDEVSGTVAIADAVEFLHCLKLNLSQTLISTTNYSKILKYFKLNYRTNI